MKISDLPPGLKELAELRRNQFAGPCAKEDSLILAFPWHMCIEPYDFWPNVDNGNFSVYHGCKVVNLKPKVQNLKHV